MSKFKYIFYRGSLELASYEEGGTEAEVVFPKGTFGEVSISGVSVPVVSGCALLKTGSLPDGKYTPVLNYNDQKYPLTSIKKEGRRILHAGYSDGELCEKFDEIRRLRSALRELTEKQKLLEEYILGKGIF